VDCPFGQVARHPRPPPYWWEATNQRNLQHVNILGVGGAVAAAAPGQIATIVGRR